MLDGVYAAAEGRGIRLHGLLPTDEGEVVRVTVRIARRSSAVHGRATTPGPIADEVDLAAGRVAEALEDIHSETRRIK
ncbi:MAG: hypothetical protein DMG07_29155 [Acidobacteria bacterium]|nr:MAG: hypothetical protein DMG07_29155 [Acidobacteriota bacterium]